MADMRYYGNVITTTRWRICVTMATLRQQQDGGYALLWQRYDNNKMAAICYYGNVMSKTRWRLCVFYIFNSTVIDWTCFFLFFCSYFTVETDYKNLLWDTNFIFSSGPRNTVWNVFDAGQVTLLHTGEFRCGCRWKTLQVLVASSVHTGKLCYVVGKK